SWETCDSRAPPSGRLVQRTQVPARRPRGAPTIRRMAQTFDICIRGAGVVGRTLALLLARERLRVALVAPPTPAAAEPDVRAYALNGASQTLLQSLRARPDAEHATPVLRMQVAADQDGAVHFDAADQG